MRPYLSIIIPYYKDPDSIGPLLTSISKSKKAPPYEVIVVDDGSPPEFRLKKLTKKPGSQCVRYKELRQKNKGPAAARNYGAKFAKGEFLVFLDSDVEVFPDTLKEIWRIFTDDPDIVALTGVWVKHQRTNKFFPNFKALRDWSYWINERDKSGYYFLFSTRIASIKRTVFARLRGFDETYSGALVEDIELTYRIARRYAVIFAPTVRVRHEFEDFWPIAKKYFWRTFHWTRLYSTRKKFDPVATTWSEALSSLSGVAVVFFGLLSILSLPTLPLILSVQKSAPIPFLVFATFYYFFFTLSLVIYILFNKTFLLFAMREKGKWFAVKSFVTGLTLCCFIAAGALWGRIRNWGER